MAIDPNSVVWDEPGQAAIDPGSIVWDDAEPAAQPAQAPSRGNPLSMRNVFRTMTGALPAPQDVGNLQAGLLRGAGSIGATALAPYDMAKDAIDGKGLSLESNRERRNAIDGGLQDLGADTDSGLYQGGKITGEILGTAGAGGVLANGARAVGAAPSVISGLSSGGMNVAGMTGLKGLGLRGASGATVGGTSAGAVNPEDAGLGAAIGGGIPVAGKVGAAVTRSAVGGAKGLLQPLYESGREQIVGRALREFSGGQADDAIRNLQAARELVPGSLPTVGEAAQVPSLAALQRSAMNTSPEAANALQGRITANNEARVDVLESLAGSPAMRSAAEDAREQAANAAYGAARGQAADGITPSQELMDLAERPAMKRFIASAKRLAADKGQKIENPLESLDGLHYVKLAVDDALAGTPANALARNQKSAVMGIKELLTAEMDKVSPAYGASRIAYQEASKPINQMDIGDELMRVVDPLTGRVRASQFAKKLADDTAKRATGFKPATLAGILTPDQLSRLGGVRDDLARAEFAQTAGRGVGSNTAQNLAYSNMMNQMGVPDFMRKFAGGEIVGKLASRAGDLVYGQANQDIAGLLANTMLDPAGAARLMMLRDTANPALLNAGRKGLLGVSRAAPVIAAD